MSSMLFEAQPRASQGLEVVNVVVAYEDTSTGWRAVRSRDLLPGPISTEQSIARRLWRWDLLGVPLLNQRAAREASRADVILLSAHGIGELPNEVKRVAETLGGCQAGALLCIRGAAGFSAGSFCQREQNAAIRAESG